MTKRTIPLIIAYTFGFLLGTAATVYIYERRPEPKRTTTLALECQHELKQFTNEEVGQFFGLPAKYKHPSYNAWTAYYDHLILECLLNKR